MTRLEGVLLGRGELLAAASGLVLTAIAVAGVQREGEHKAFILMVGGAAFVAVVIGFMQWPHVLVAGTVVYFTLLPTFKVFVSPQLGATKDLIDIAAVTAAVILYLERRRHEMPTTPCRRSWRPSSSSYFSTA